MSVATPSAPPIPAELEQTMRQLKMPYARGIAPDVFATARAQRWEPAEIVKAVLDAEVTGRKSVFWPVSASSAVAPMPPSMASYPPRHCA